MGSSIVAAQMSIPLPRAEWQIPTRRWRARKTPSHRMSDKIPLLKHVTELFFGTDQELKMCWSTESRFDNFHERSGTQQEIYYRDLVADASFSYPLWRLIKPNSTNMWYHGTINCRRLAVAPSTSRERKLNVFAICGRCFYWASVSTKVFRSWKGQRIDLSITYPAEWVDSLNECVLSSFNLILSTSSGIEHETLIIWLLSEAFLCKCKQSASFGFLTSTSTWKNTCTLPWLLVDIRHMSAVAHPPYLTSVFEVHRVNSK